MSPQPESVIRFRPTGADRSARSEPMVSARQPALPDHQPPVDDRRSTRLNPASGLLLGLAVGALLWLGIGFVAWQFFR